MTTAITICGGLAFTTFSLVDCHGNWRTNENAPMVKIASHHPSVDDANPPENNINLGQSVNQTPPWCSLSLLSPFWSDNAGNISSHSSTKNNVCKHHYKTWTHCRTQKNASGFNWKKLKPSLLLCPSLTCSENLKTPKKTTWFQIPEWAKTVVQNLMLLWILTEVTQTPNPKLASRTQHESNE